MGWSNCTEACDGGTQTRVRTIKQEAAFGGLSCSGYATESKNCNEQPCQRDCQWAPFAEWTPCSKSCGTGEQTRARIQLQTAANGGHDCQGLGTESRNCNTQPCPISCSWSSFSAWTPCSQKCGGGYQMRTRKVTTEAQYGGKACAGCATDSRACNAEPCAANCKWAPWHAWSECTATCGGGVQNRTREVLQAASNGGKDCQGPAAQFRDCIQPNAQLTANGAHGENGMSVHEHVAEECRPEAEQSQNKKDTEENLVKEIHKKCKDATCKPVQFARTAQDMHDSAQHGQSIAATVSSSRVVVRSLVDCAKNCQS